MDVSEKCKITEWQTNEDLFHRYEEAELRAEELAKQIQEGRISYQREVAAMQEMFSKSMAETMKTISDLKEELRAYREENAALKQEIRRLKSILNNDSNNASNLPSTDEMVARRKANEYSNREPSGKKRGGQIGHS